MAALVIGALLVAIGPAPADAAFPGKNGRIVFNRGGSGIFTVKPNGKGVRRIRRDGFDSAFSPNGRKIAFVREDRRFRGHIYTMNAHGHHLRRLTRGSTYDEDPAFSPNGKQIVFTRRPASRDSEIFKMRANGSRQRRLTGNGRDDYQPAWSPKGNRIAYTGERSGGYADIFTLNPRSGRRRAVTKTERRTEYTPAWSPDGKKLAFGAAYLGMASLSGLYKISANGSGERSLTSDPNSGDEPAWSPDGRRIVYRHLYQSDWVGLVTIKAGGTAVAAFGRGDDQNPDWQPR